jgi:outer membrane protein TolC
MNDPDLPLASRDIEIIPIDAVEAGVHVVRHPIAALRARFMNRAARLQAELKALKKSTRGQQADAEQRLMALTDEWETLFAQYRKDLHAIELSEVMTALDHREELESSRLLVDRAKLLLGAAKNQALPRFDLITRYNTSGLGSNSDRAFDQLIEYDFEDWFVGVEFELPLGNRAARAAKRRWRAEVSKAMAAVQDGIEGISAQVLFNTGALETNLVKIESLVEGLRANQVRVEATVARAENRGPGQVDMELRAYIAVASSGEGLLNALVDYNMALIDLERAKGTLLEYNSVILAD